ncbi:hypothetical protein EDC94DRAFT_525116 [Helicostylum pulchrum]|nr:hypothetical protein EDC94DRAFT_525116 [Helicostylum pulchrum]
MILLILYYVYKWITVPWAYYDTARSRRVIHQYATNNNNQAGLDSNKKRDKRKESVEEELRKHEFIGLVWVIISPAVAGYTLQYSRYFLSNYDKYMSTFNVTVFVLAASLKPLIHVMALLRERTVFLQSEMVINESEIEVLQRKLESMEEELDGLRKAFATKRDLGQVTNGITPSIQNLSNAIRQFEKKDKSFRSWSEENFSKMEKRVCDLDQLLYFSMEQDQKKSAQKLLVTLMFLPINLTFWAASRMAGLLPIPRALLGFTVNKSPRPTSSYRPNSKHLTHPDVHTSADASSSMQPDTFFHRRHATTAREPSEHSYSEE